MTIVQSYCTPKQFLAFESLKGFDRRSLVPEFNIAKTLRLLSFPVCWQANAEDLAKVSECLPRRNQYGMNEPITARLLKSLTSNWRYIKSR